MLKKWAFLGIGAGGDLPGGPWLVFESLRSGLSAHGIELRWLDVGDINDVATCVPWSRQAHCGEVVHCSDKNERIIAETLRLHLESHYSGCIVNVLCQRLCTNLMRYMPKKFPRIMLVHSTTIGTYKAARTIRDVVHATVGVSLRIQQDLITKYEFDPEHTFYIPNSVPAKRFSRMRSSRKGALRILLLSRIENLSKGCFRLPEILRMLHEEGVQYKCTVAGDGPDLEELKRRSVGLNVEFVGWLSVEQVPEIISQHDVYLFLSNFEGFPISLVEAMAGGAVPVSSRLKGVTDQSVEDGASGLLVRSDDIVGYVLALKQLSESPELLERMRSAAVQRAEEHFSVEIVSVQFADLLTKVINHPRHLTGKTLDFHDWSYPLGLRAGLRTFLPEALKNKLRLMRERLASR